MSIKKISFYCSSLFILRIIRKQQVLDVKAGGTYKVPRGFKGLKWTEGNELSKPLRSMEVKEASKFPALVHKPTRIKRGRTNSDVERVSERTCKMVSTSDRVSLQHTGLSHNYTFPPESARQRNMCVWLHDCMKTTVGQSGVGTWTLQDDES
jgi:hypothetical protein